MADGSRRAVFNNFWALAVSLSLGCDALAPRRDEEVAVDRGPQPAPPRPEPPPPAKDLRQPVVPGYLAPPTKADPTKAAPTKPAPVVPAPVEPAPVEQPAWRAALAEADALSATGAWQDYPKVKAAETRAFAAIRALPADDPGYVEAQCELAERGHVGADVEAALLGALARLRAHPPADPYAHLDRDDLLRTALHASIEEDGAVRMSPDTGLASVRDCERADVASLQMMLIDSYHTYAMFRRAYPEVTPPAVADPFKAASQALLDLHAELVKKYGARHARPAALVERMYWACHWSHRKQHPKVCYREDKDEAKVYEQALAARLATYGEDHPLTRASLLRVGALRLAAGKTAEARGLLTRAMAGEFDGESKATAAAILALLAFDAGARDDGLALFARIEANGDTIYGADWWTHGAMLQLYSSALQAAGRPADALRVFKKHLAIQPKPRGGSLLPTPGYAELLTAAGEHDEAIAEYGRRIAHANELEATGANFLARDDGRSKRLADLTARAAVRRAAGDASGADADLAEVRAIRSGPPVVPDP